MPRVDHVVHDDRPGVLDGELMARTELGRRVRSLQRQRMRVHVERRAARCTRSREHVVDDALAGVERRIAGQVECAVEKLTVAVVAVDDDGTEIRVRPRTFALDVVRPAFQHLPRPSRNVETRAFLDIHRAAIAHLETRDVEDAFLHGDRTLDLVVSIDLEDARPLLDDRIVRTDRDAEIRLHIRERLRHARRDLVRVGRRMHEPRHRNSDNRRQHLHPIHQVFSFRDQGEG